MTKVSEVRSAIRRVTLVKAAQDAWRKAQDAEVARIRAALAAKLKAGAKAVARPVLGLIGR